MWHPSSAFRSRGKINRNQGRRLRSYQPICKLLEERCLLSVVLTENVPPAPLVGSPVTWTATASGDGSTPVYQFKVGEPDGSNNVVQDFSLSNSFTWNPMEEGTYEIQVIVKNSDDVSAGESASASYTATSRIVGTSAVISPMANPLVALFSAPPTAGVSIYVQYAQQNSTPSWISTNSLPIVEGKSTNFIVAGMRPNTTYLMRYVLDDGIASTPLTFTTGSLPSNLQFPTVTTSLAPTAGNDASQNMIVHSGINEPDGTISTFATDLQGNIIWYYDSIANNFPGYATTLAPNGTVYLLSSDTMRQVDLAGDTLHQTDISAVNAELAAKGYNPITDFDHDAQLLPNGDIVVVALTPRVVDLNGTPTNYNGNMIIVLDQNLQVAWVWDSFQWLDTSRLPTLGEGPLDWLHANSVDYSPEDGDLIVSLRAQDWVVKIDYANGTGDGHTVWTLGAGGDFTIVSSDPDPWFSHQHDARYINDNTIVLFDDGNTRVANDPNEPDSRGQELVLNEQTMTATLVVNADLGTYSAALGSAQALPDGNLAFTSGFQSNNDSQTIEVLPDGTQTFVQSISGYEYRSYLTSSLYIDPSSSPAPVAPPVIGSPPGAVNASQNVAFVNQRVGTFTYPLASLFPTGTTLPAGLPASDFTATINWGDSTSTTGGTITQDTVNPDLYYVSGGHTYATAATYGISMTVTLNAAAITGTLDGTAITLDPPEISVLGTSATANVAARTIAVTPLAITGTAGLPIPAGPIAKFIDSSGPNPDSDYSASITITGADGFSLVIPAASITEVGTTNRYTVNALSLTLPEQGTYAINVSVTDTGNTPSFTASGSSTATIIDAPLTAGPSVIFVPRGVRTVLSGPIGTFTDANPAASLSDLRAIIDWADNSPSSVGRISQPGGAGTAFAVNATHAYVHPGDYRITTVVTDVGGSQIVLNTTVNLGYPKTAPYGKKHPLVNSTGLVITSLGFNRLNATLTVTYLDNPGAMDLANLSNLAFYHISASPSRSRSHVTYGLVPKGVLHKPRATRTGAVTVQIVFQHKHILPPGIYTVLINSGAGNTGIHDLVGKALDGTLH
jgi:arylsulfate sulfotransferase